MTKQEIPTISSTTEKLIQSATKADWKYVKAVTRLPKQRLYEYRKGLSDAHKEAIETALATAIAARLKAEAKHQAKITRLLETAEKEAVSIDVKGSLSKKYGQR